MEAKHTPGPWRFEPHGMFGETDDDGSSFPFGYISTAPAPMPIFGLDVFLEYAPAELEANARLMAAAPDMLLALVWLASVLHPDTSDESADEQCTLAYAAALAAIAKATGEPNA